MKIKVVLSVIGMVLSLGMIIVTDILAENQVIGVVFSTVLVIVSVCGFFATALALAKAEYETSFYECRNCGYVFKPTFAEYLCGAHTPKTRRLECPKCGRKTWCKRQKDTDIKKI